MTRVACSLLLIAFYLPSAFGQSAKTDSSKVYYSNPVVVTGTQAMMSDRLLPATVSVVTSNELQSSGNISLLDALSERVPGLFVAKSGILGYGINSQAGTITARGVGGKPNTQVLVMIDGIPQFMGIFGHPLPDSYLSENAERVEVVRGPASLLYGTNAMGGVINVITRTHSRDGSSLRAGVSYGSYNTQEYNAAIGYHNDGLDIMISADRDLTDGHRPNSSFSTGSGYLNSGYFIDDNFSLRLNGIINKFKTYDPGTVFSPLVNNWVDVLRSTIGLSLKNKFSGFEGSVKLFYSYGDHSVYDGFHSLDRNVGLLFYQNYHTSNGSIITVGGDYRHYGGTAVNNISGTAFGTHYVDEYGAYVLVAQLLFDKVMLNAGSRLEFSGVYGGEIVPQGGMAWTAANTTTLKASISRGFRSPTIRELYLFPAPNPNLDPERMWNYEISLLQEVDRHARLELTGFISEGSNLIIEEGTYPNLQLLNSGTFTHRGIEVAGHYDMTGNLTADASYSYVDPGNQTYSTPKQKLFIGINWTYRRAVIDMTLEHIADLYGADNSRERLPDYTVLGAHVSYQASEFAQVFITGDNLFNSSYQTIYGYPMPGRTFFAGVNLRVENTE